MRTIFNYDSESIALRKLDECGYTIDYNIVFDRVYNHKENYAIDYLYRYEGDSNPSDESSVYGLRNIITGEKGVFVLGCLSLIDGRIRDIIVNLEVEFRHFA